MRKHLILLLILFALGSCADKKPVLRERQLEPHQKVTRIEIAGMDARRAERIIRDAALKYQAEILDSRSAPDGAHWRLAAPYSFYQELNSELTRSFKGALRKIEITTQEDFLALYGNNEENIERLRAELEEARARKASISDYDSAVLQDAEIARLEREIRGASLLEGDYRDRLGRSQVIIDLNNERGGRRHE